jgi:hypothetical protein
MSILGMTNPERDMTVNLNAGNAPTFLVVRAPVLLEIMEGRNWAPTYFVRLTPLIGE